MNLDHTQLKHPVRPIESSQNGGCITCNAFRVPRRWTRHERDCPFPFARLDRDPLQNAPSPKGPAGPPVRAYQCDKPEVQKNGVKLSRCLVGGGRLLQVPTLYTTKNTAAALRTCIVCGCRMRLPSLLSTMAPSLLFPISSHLSSCSFDDGDPS